MKIGAALRRSGEALLGLLFPPHCAGCKAETVACEHLCQKCREQVRRIEPPFCNTCSEPFFGAIEGEFSCVNCAGRKLHFDCAVARCMSRGVVREFIHSFKYDRAMHLRHALCDWLAESMEDARIRAQPFDALVPVPLHSTRRREREFNQADVLARLLGRRIGAPVLDCLRRTRYTTTQTRLDRHERMENLRGAFRMARRRSAAGKHLLLVDDVFTTGSTVDECARVLRAAGAASVRVITVARG